MPIDVNAVGKPFDPTTFEYKDRDVMLYALGVGCGVNDLAFTYEKGLRVLPTFAVIPAFPAFGGMGKYLQFNPMMVLHGEHRIELLNPIPTAGRLTTSASIRAIYDKGSGAVIVVDAETKDEKGQTLFKNTMGAFIRGEGGFGGERGPSATSRNVPPERAPDATVEMKTSPDQALLYRLSGDRNPLHADPEFAKMAGFDRPILHGLCTYGHVGRAALNAFCDGDPGRFRAFEARFSGVVFPGETITTQMWRESPKRILVQAKTERGEPVLSNAAVDIA